jgi:hypothetical protein
MLCLSSNKDERISIKIQPLRELSTKTHDTIKTHLVKIPISEKAQKLQPPRMPTPYCFNRHPSPFTFASELFEPLFSHFRSTNSAYNHQSTATGLTNVIEAMSSAHPDPYHLDTPFVPQQTDGT